MAKGATRTAPRLIRRTIFTLAEVLQLLYLHGLSTGDFVPAPEGFLGSAAGLSSATITRLTKRWTDDYHAFCQPLRMDRRSN